MKLDSIHRISHLVSYRDNFTLAFSDTYALQKSLCSRKTSKARKRNSRWNFHTFITASSVCIYVAVCFVDREETKSWRRAYKWWANSETKTQKPEKSSRLFEIWNLKQFNAHSFDFHFNEPTANMVMEILWYERRLTRSKQNKRERKIGKTFSGFKEA